MLDLASCLGQCSPQKFFYGATFQGQKPLGQYDHRGVMMPSSHPAEAGPSLMIQTELFVELLVILIDCPARFGQSHPPPQAATGRQLGEQVLDRRRSAFGPPPPEPRSNTNVMRNVMGNDFCCRPPARRRREIGLGERQVGPALAGRPTIV